MDPDLIEAVTVQVEPLRGERLTAPQLALRQREVVPDRVAQMRQGEPPPHTRPAGGGALRPAEGPARPPRAAAAPTHSFVPGQPPNFSPSSTNTARGAPRARSSRR